MLKWKHQNKPLPVSNRSCNLLSKAVKRVDKFQETYQPETCSNLDLVSELKLVVTNDISCQTDFQCEIGRPRYNDADHLISALNKHLKSFEKKLDEKQIIIETLLQNVLITTLLLIAIIKLIRFLLKISTLP